MGNLGDGCDIFAKLSERQIKNKLCSNGQEEVRGENTKRRMIKDRETQ
jgi:hypothetical protein